MSFLNIHRVPDRVVVQFEDGWFELNKTGEESWHGKSIELTTECNADGVFISVSAAGDPVKRIVLRWKGNVPQKLMFLCDHWERAYGDLEWRGMVPDRIMPWYFMTYDRLLTHGYGVKTSPGAMCYWQADPSGVSLCLDVRCGGVGVKLGDRRLQAAVAVCRQGQANETPYSAAQSFCRMMCERPLVPPHPVYGGNNWYYAYGKSSHNEILEDSKIISSLASSRDNRPYMVIDAGWQDSGPDKNIINGGPWLGDNQLFPDMQGLAAQMKDISVRPGLWFRPLTIAEKVADSWLLPDAKSGNSKSMLLDPSNQDVLDWIGEDVKRFQSWGYEMIKHDFSTYDIFGKWGFEMGNGLTADGWSFFDKGKTTAEILSGLYTRISKSAGNSLIIGCNTIGHLAAGLFHIQRTGDDTSGMEWDRTRKMGINTLAFRMPQQDTFFAADADCVGLTSHIPWELNKQWLYLLSQSGTPLFVSVSPDALGSEQKRAIEDAFDAASKPLPPAQPLDWLETTCPEKWLIQDKIVQFDWFHQHIAGCI